MNDTWLAVTWVAAFVVIGVVIAVTVTARAGVARARAKAEAGQRYQELAERCAAGQQQTAEELGRLTERVAAVEKLLRDVG